MTRYRKPYRRPVVPHHCPATPDGRFLQNVTVDNLRAAGLADEADRLAQTLKRDAMWRLDGKPIMPENGYALGLFGCCEHARLGVLIEQETDGLPS